MLTDGAFTTAFFSFAKESDLGMSLSGRNVVELLPIKTQLSLPPVPINRSLSSLSDIKDKVRVFTVCNVKLNG